MRLRKLILGGLALLSLAGLHAQHSCGTDDYYHKMKQFHPEMEAAEHEYNQKIEANKISPKSRATKYTIPVVFHVIHTNGAENISREQILDQLRVLNEDFSFTNANKNKIRSVFTSVAADCEVRFELAKIDPNGNCTEGINRIYSPLGVEVDMTTQEVKGLIQWNYQKYLNIWVVTSIKTDQSGTVLGYAQFPWMSDKSKDGIVLRHDRVGTIGTADASDLGRTLTHEVGHWLGLYHTFQGGCNDGDFCDDTPPVNGAYTNANCPPNGNSCTNDNPDLPDQWENFMDYSNGSCQAMYTFDQRNRMHGFLGQSPRNSNVTASNLQATGITLVPGAPVAQFSSSSRIICAGQSVTFYDISCKSAVTSRSWTLTGSSTPNSSAANPTVVYQTPGKYKVTLLVQNSSGSNSKSVEQYIEVLPATAQGSPNFEEGFETDAASRGFVSTSPKAWEYSNSVGYTTAGAMKAPVKSSDPLGTTFSFQLPPVNLSLLSSSSLKMTFFAAYAPSSAENSEVLRVYVSTDCGSTYRQLLERSGTGLAYSGAPVTSNFVPQAKNQWKLMGLTSLSALGLHTSTNAIFRIDVTGMKGNPVYIDNINISPFFASTESFGNEPSLSLYPNPTESIMNIDFQTTANQEYSVTLLNQVGRVVKYVATGKGDGNSVHFEIQNTGDLNGIYLLNLVSGKSQITKPVTFVP